MCFVLEIIFISIKIIRSICCEMVSVYIVVKPPVRSRSLGLVASVLQEGQKTNKFSQSMNISVAD